MAAKGEQDTADTTALSNTLAMPSPGGTVTVCTTNQNPSQANFEKALARVLLYSTAQAPDS
jgi:hypothetical protein